MVRVALAFVRQEALTEPREGILLSKLRLKEDLPRSTTHTKDVSIQRELNLHSLEANLPALEELKMHKEKITNKLALVGIILTN